MVGHIILTNELDEEELEDFSDRLFDERENLDKELGQSILMVADLGLWYGRREAYKFLRRTNLNEIFSETCGDYVTWYVEEGEVKCKDIHHDGTNYYTYRALKAEFTEEDFNNYSFSNSTEEAIRVMTEPLGAVVCDIYGWNTGLELETKEAVG